MMPVTLSAEEFAQKYGGSTTLSAEDFAKKYGPDVRTAIADRKANPPAAAKGDPNAPQESTLETYFPAAAHPLSALGGVARAMNPLPAITDPAGTLKNEEDARMAAFARLRQNASPSDPETWRDAATYAIPFLGGAMANAGRSMASTNPSERASGFGEAVGLTSGPQLAGKVLGAGADLANSTAVSRYAKVFGKNANPADAQAVAAALIRDRVRSSNPNADLADLGEKRVQVGEAKLDTAIQNMPGPVKAGPILDRIDKARLDQYNQVPTEAGDAVLAANGPDAPSMVNYLQKYADNVKENANASGDITPQNALNLKQAYDLKPGQRGAYSGKEVTSTDVAARATVADSLRKELNSDPNVAAANKETSAALKLKGLAEGAPENKAIATPYEGVRALGGLGLFPHMHGFGAMLEASAVVPILYKAITSPWWRTTSAVLQSRVADLIKSGDYNGAADIAVRASQQDDTTTAARMLMQSKQGQ